MSATQTDNPISSTLHQASSSSSTNNYADNGGDHLRDYDVHLSTTEAVPEPTTTTTTTATTPSPVVTAVDAPLPTTTNPPDWPIDTYRGFPPYRPINTGLDRTSRPWGGNPVGDAFVFTMFTGVFTVANANRLWRQTGGRINDRIFRYKVGGEI